MTRSKHLTHFKIHLLGKFKDCTNYLEDNGRIIERIDFNSFLHIWDGDTKPIVYEICTKEEDLRGTLIVDFIDLTDPQTGYSSYRGDLAWIAEQRIAQHLSAADIRYFDWYADLSRKMVDHYNVLSDYAEMELMQWSGSINNSVPNWLNDEILYDPHAKTAYGRVDSEDKRQRDDVVKFLLDADYIPIKCYEAKKDYMASLRTSDGRTLQW